MEKTKVFRNGGSLAVRLPKRYALPPGEIFIEERDGLLILHPAGHNDWPADLETRFAALADFEPPPRPRDSKPVDF